MLPALGLYGHIRNNNLKSGILLAGFPVLMAAFWFSLCLFWMTFTWTPTDIPESADVQQRLWRYMQHAGGLTLATWYLPAISGLVWLVIAYTFHARLISIAMGTRELTRREHPNLYNMVEQLAIGAGLPMPRVEVMNTGALNAYAAGLSPDTATIAVTRGLLRTLTPAEVEAVLAHEMTHIKNRDVRLMVVALVLAGGLTFVGGMAARLVSGRADTGWRMGDIGDVGSGLPGIDDLELEGPTAIASLVATLVSVVLAISVLATVHLFALLSKFAISRSREYLADAGAVELTKNPDALIAALTKISGHDIVPRVPASLCAMMISNPFEGLFSTHPSIADRIDKLQRLAGGRMPEQARHDRRSVAASGEPIAADALRECAAAFAKPEATQIFGRRRARRRAA